MAIDQTNGSADFNQPGGKCSVRIQPVGHRMPVACIGHTKGHQFSLQNDDTNMAAALARYRDFMSYVLLSAPDDFPAEDSLSSDEQITHA
ncbi:hypothetical protein [Burkholderia sp. NLJ2]|uniref:hypothetical protein n=1 Tax=Burkholderia sp. NLJ2 TaxID=3090699 RepID=UPI003C6BFDDF